MKTFIAIIFSMLIVVSFSINAESTGHQTGGCMDGQAMEMKGDSESHSMMMDEIAADPEMRHQMMQKMMESTNMDMHQMMNNPEMKARMQMHMEMMQAMMGSNGMDQSKMKEMMENPEMMDMMKMDMMGMQMMNDAKAGEDSAEDGGEHVH